MIGHLWFAAKDPHARAGMRTGRVPLGWARREHSAWAAEATEAAEAAEAADQPRLHS